MTITEATKMISDVIKQLEHDQNCVVRAVSLQEMAIDTPTERKRWRQVVLDLQSIPAEG